MRCSAGLRTEATLSVALGEVGDVVLVEILVEGRPQQLLGQVGQDGRRPGDGDGEMDGRDGEREMGGEREMRRRTEE